MCPGVVVVQAGAQVLLSVAALRVHPSEVLEESLCVYALNDLTPVEYSFRLYYTLSRAGAAA